MVWYSTLTATQGPSAINQAYTVVQECLVATADGAALLQSGHVPGVETTPSQSRLNLRTPRGMLGIDIFFPSEN